MSLLCKAMGHRRSRQWATYDAAEHRWKSICLRCHKRLIREANGQWVDAKQANKEAA